MRARRWIAVLVATSVLGWGGAARAQVADLSEYERETVAAALRASDGEIDPEPEGKRIEAIEAITLEVLDESDPLPDFLNALHSTTLPEVIRRELLFQRDGHYRQRQVDESARNLRSLPQFSLVLIVPVRGSRPDSVRVLVITKDVWSLRLASYIEASNDGLVTLWLQPSETNLAGTHSAVSLLFTLYPDTYSLGGGLAVPRLAGSRIRSSASANVIQNRHSGRTEGSFGRLVHGQPLYALDARWAWGVFLSWRSDIDRSYVGTEQRTYDATATPLVDDRIPLQYDRDVWLAEYELVRSYGHRTKFDVSFGIEAKYQEYDPGDLSGYARAATAEFVTEEVPLSDTRVGPFVQLRIRGTDFMRTRNLDTLALQEDYRTGPDATLRVYPASGAVASSRDVFGIFAAGSYTVALGDGLARAILASTTELSDSDRTDALFEGATHLVTPRMPMGRLIYGARVAHRYRDYYNRRFELGGGGRLRGYAVNEFRGKDVLVSNLEWRTPSLGLWSGQLGGALFYDVGDAFDGFERLRPKHGAGFGVRVLIPQVDRITFRMDWGFPLDPDHETLPGAWFFTFGQAASVPAIRRSGAADPMPSWLRGSAISPYSWAGEAH
jgi:hypothetical protein